MSEGEWPHHQILRVHRQYAFRQHLKLQAAIPYLSRRKAIPKSLRNELEKSPEHEDDNINFLLGYLREARVERFVRFVEALGDSAAEIKSHGTLIDTMSENLDQISNVDLEQVRRVRTVVKRVREGHSLETEVEEGTGTETEVVEPGDNSKTISDETEIMTKEVHSESEGTHKERVVTTEPEVSTTLHKDPTTTEAKLFATPQQEASTVIVAEEDSKEERYAKTHHTKTTSHLTVQHRGFVEPRCVEFFCRDSLTDDEHEWLYHDSAHGVRIAIPVDAVPPEINVFAVISHAYLGGNFQVPEDYDICTAVVVLKTDPNFEFIKPVSLKLPHAAIFDDDDEPEEWVVLRAFDPDTPVDRDSHATQTYVFSDVISDADYSEDYYVRVNLDHFSAVVGANCKRKSKYRKRKGSLRHPLSMNRQGSVNKERRGRKRAMKKRVNKFQKGDSIGSSRQSSRDGSFDGQSPLPRQCSSTESDGPFTKQLLQRQGAIQRDDDYPSPHAAPLLQQASSTEDDNNYSIKIIICCCGPQKCTTNWTTRFMVGPDHPTGLRALTDAVAAFEKRSRVKMEAIYRVAYPSNNTTCIRFTPGRPCSSMHDWSVNATSTPEISLNMVNSCTFQQVQPQYIDFDVEKTNQSSSERLFHVINVVGATTATGEEIYFTIKSTDSSTDLPSSIINTQSWLYPDGSQLLHTLKAMNAEEDKDDDGTNIALNPYLRHRASQKPVEHCDTDHCKLLSEIALQLPLTVYDELMEKLKLSEVERSCLRVEEAGNPSEGMYKALLTWIFGKHRPHLRELKCILTNVGFSDIKVCCTDIPLLTANPELFKRECDRYLCTRLADKLGRQWRFVGRYLGVRDADLDNLLCTADKEGRTDAVSKMFEKWRQQYATAASVAVLVRAIFRVYELNSSYVTEAFWFMQEEVDESL